MKDPQRAKEKGHMKLEAEIGMLWNTIVRYHLKLQETWNGLSHGTFRTLVPILDF
jgi:hypothetical protein